MADFGYDISDYTDVDPRFGTLADFDELVAQAGARGLRVIVDWVANHTSDRHPWFAESRSSRDAARRDWYVWRDGRGEGVPPNGWLTAWKKPGPAWTWDERTAQWYLHSFLAEQPDLNWDNPEVERAMFDVLRFWLDRGAGGFRLDVAYKLGKDPALGDDEPGRPHREHWPTVHERLRRHARRARGLRRRAGRRRRGLRRPAAGSWSTSTRATSCTWSTTSTCCCSRGAPSASARSSTSSASWPSQRCGPPGA